MTQGTLNVDFSLLPRAVFSPTFSPPLLGTDSAKRDSYSLFVGKVRDSGGRKSYLCHIRMGDTGLFRVNGALSCKQCQTLVTHP